MLLDEGESVRREMESDCIEAYEVNKIAGLVEWFNGLLDIQVPPGISEDEFRDVLLDGTVLCATLERLGFDITEESKDGDQVSSEQQMSNIGRFLSAVDKMGFPTFSIFDLQQGTISPVIDCLLYLRDHINQDELISNEENFPVTLEMGKGLIESDLQNGLQEPSIHHIQDNLLEVLQLKHGLYSDSSSKILEFMKSNNLQNASTQSLTKAMHNILEESIEKKNGEIPDRIAHLLRKAIEEIEQRISNQALHIHHLNNAIKTRERKHQSRLEVHQTITKGMNEEIEITRNQLLQTKSEKLKIEDMHKVKDEELFKLIQEKDNCVKEITTLQKEIEFNNESFKKKYLKLEVNSQTTKLEMEGRLKTADSDIAQLRKRIQELEALLKLNDHRWSRKEHVYQNFLNVQMQALENMRVVSGSIKKEMTKTHKLWEEECGMLGRKLKGITDAAENYHTVLAENRRLNNEVQELKGNIRVYCRVRPFLRGQNTRTTSIDFIGENGELLVRNPLKQGKDGHRMFKFNKVFGPAVSQEDVFFDTQPLIRSVLDGYSVCIFAYGQTGSGKTYTMSGPNVSSKEEWGVNYRALSDLFHISRTRRNTFIYEVGVQMVEIYNEQVRDLLSSESTQKKLGIWSTSQPNGLVVPDASMHPVKSTLDVLALMEIGQLNRAVGATALNERSSRSHSILTVHVRGTDLENGSTLRGCLHLVDLAGSERVDRSEATGERLKEAQHINKSLSALGDVIFALAQKCPHVPYRNSKLTQVLQSSLGGQAKTLMFVQINPDVESYLETMSTLKFAERVSGVELGAARRNKESKDVRSLMDQVASLKDALARKDEEIGRLQLVKDLRSQSSSIGKKNVLTKSPRHSPSFPSSGPSTRFNAKGASNLLSKKLSSFSNIKDASDLEVGSECSEKRSECGSLQSIDDLNQCKEVPSNLIEGDSADIDLLGFGDGDSEERLSDISDSGLSMGTETDGSICSLVEYVLFPEVKRPPEDQKENGTRTQTQVARPPLKKSISQILNRSKLKKAPSSSRKTSNAQVTSLSSRPSKHWQ